MQIESAASCWEGWRQKLCCDPFDKVRVAVNSVPVFNWSFPVPIEILTVSNMQLKDAVEAGLVNCEFGDSATAERLIAPTWPARLTDVDPVPCADNPPETLTTALGKISLTTTDPGQPPDALNVGAGTLVGNIVSCSHCPAPAEIIRSV